MLTLTAKARGGMAPELKVDVATLDDAADALRAWIDGNMLGASQCAWPHPNGVGVVKDGRKTVAVVAYNGRVYEEVRA